MAQSVHLEEKGLNPDGKVLVQGERSLVRWKGFMLDGVDQVAIGGLPSQISKAHSVWERIRTGEKGTFGKDNG